MRANTINIISRRRRSVRRRRALALALAVCALAIPASASAEPIDGWVGALTGGPSQSSGSDGDSGYSSANAITGAGESEPTVVSGRPAGTGDGFDWASAAVGAGAALGLAALGGAALLTVRRRTTVSPTASTS